MITIYDNLNDAEIVEAASIFTALHLATAMSKQYTNITIYAKVTKIFAITQDPYTIDMLRAYANGYIACWYK